MKKIVLFVVYSLWTGITNAHSHNPKSDLLIFVLFREIMGADKLLSLSIVATDSVQKTWYLNEAYECANNAEDILAVIRPSINKKKNAGSLKDVTDFVSFLKKETDTGMARKTKGGVENSLMYYELQAAKAMHIFMHVDYFDKETKTGK